MIAFVRRLALAASAAALILAVAGCGRPRYTVSGRVAYSDGTPYASEGFVIAEAVVDEKPIMARGLIGPDGRFTLAGRNQDDGIMAATYKLRLVPPPLVGGIDSPQAQKMPFDKKFMQFDTSGLSFEVRSSSDDLEIDLGPKP